MKINLILYPFLFAAYPVLAMLSFNKDQVALTGGVRPLVLALALAAILLLLFRGLLGNISRAALLASLALVLFFSYGHVYRLIGDSAVTDVAIGRHRYLLGAWIFIFAAGAWLIWKKIARPEALTSTLNAIAIFALILPTYWLASAAIAGLEENSSRPASASAGSLAGEASMPDIYYIILDGYGHQDVLQALYQYDNMPFLNGLEERGFFIGWKSRTNYPLTLLSLSSSLNMDYLENYIEISELDIESSNTRPLVRAIKHSRVREIFSGMGYKLIAFSSAFAGTSIFDADEYLSHDQKADTDINQSPSLLDYGIVTPFEMMVFESTGGLLISEMTAVCLAATNGRDVQLDTLPIKTQIACRLGAWLLPTINYPYEDLRDQVLFDFEILPNLPDLGAPRFVFAHMVAPHFPFVFGPDGEFSRYTSAFSLDLEGGFTGSYGTYVRGYRDEVVYINKRILETVDDILANSSIPPIIIIQSDHGPNATTVMEGQTDPPPITDIQERFPILNVYYLPPSCDHDQLYESITPVNAFRMILNSCFGADYELLEDRSYNAEYLTPYKVKDITDQVVGRE
jgi:hypothetical protein